MDDFVTKPKARISVTEMERRREIVREVDADNRIEGIFRDPASDEIFDAFVRGDIEAAEVMPRLKAQFGPR